MTARPAATAPRALQQLLPEPRDVPTPELADFTAALAEPLDLVAFDDDVLRFCASLATELRRAAAKAPELAALAFWLRPAALARLRAEIGADAAPVARVPRGTVLAIPPANVDTVFAYTWLLSLLLGNRTVLRVPGRAGPQLTTLLACAQRALASCPPRVRRATVVVTYEHDDDVTAALSAGCGLRIVWGSDVTVARLRRVPLPPAARELSFGHRTALALLDAGAVTDLDATGLSDLARRFVADAYPFDQRACSSPRAVAWLVGPAAAAATPGLPPVREVFWTAVRAELDRRAERDTAAPGTSGLDALTAAYDLAIDLPGAAVTTFGTDLTLVSGVDLAGDDGDWRARHVGGGAFAEVAVADLDELAALVVRGDQTLTVFGLPADEVAALVAAVGPRGVDRVVPVGGALEFSRWWDGVDLVAELTRAVHRPAARPAGVRPSATP